MVTLDTNIVVYALTHGAKRERARAALIEAHFVSAQVLNEYANVAWRKLGRQWSDIAIDLDLLRRAAGRVAPVDGKASLQAVRIAERYGLSFYDATLISVALENGATQLYSEDMHHSLVIDGKLTIINPFKSPDLA